MCSAFFLFQLRAPVFPTPGQSEEWGWRHALRGARCSSTTAGAECGGTNTEAVVFGVWLRVWLALLCVPTYSCTRTGPDCPCLGTVEDLTQLSLLVPISSEQAEEAEKEDLRVQLKRHHPSSPLSSSKASKRPKIKVSLISQGDPAGGPCTPSQGGTPEGEFPLTELSLGL